MKQRGRLKGEKLDNVPFLGTNVPFLGTNPKCKWVRDKANDDTIESFRKERFETKMIKIFFVINTSSEKVSNPGSLV
jgi:hypothetical protein